jgi:hypothetical protein
LFLKTLVAALAVLFVPIQGRDTFRRNTTVRLFHDPHCKDFYMDMEVWADTCANWMGEGFNSHVVLRRGSTWHLITHTFYGHTCDNFSGVIDCTGNKWPPACFTQGGATAHAINSWRVSIAGELCL